MHYLIAYDIAENRIRNQVAKLLEKRGRRLQYSVFYADLAERECQGLWQELQQLIENAERPLLLVAPLCSACYGRILMTGEPMEKERAYIVA